MLLSIEWCKLCEFKGLNESSCLLPLQTLLVPSCTFIQQQAAGVHNPQGGAVAGEAGGAAPSIPLILTGWAGREDPLPVNEKWAIYPSMRWDWCA